jgi:hypothetical protein
MPKLATNTPGPIRRQRHHAPAKRKRFGCRQPEYDPCAGSRAGADTSEFVKVFSSAIGTGSCSFTQFSCARQRSTAPGTTTPARNRACDHSAPPIPTIRPLAPSRLDSTTRRCRNGVRFSIAGRGEHHDGHFNVHDPWGIVGTREALSSPMRAAWRPQCETRGAGAVNRFSSTRPVIRDRCTEAVRVPVVKGIGARAADQHQAPSPPTDGASIQKDVRRLPAKVVHFLLQTPCASRA